MPKPPKRARDVNQLAKQIVALSTGEGSEDERQVNPEYAKRGEARAAKLSPKERSKIAKKAARARWRGK